MLINPEVFPDARNVKVLSYCGIYVNQSALVATEFRNFVGLGKPEVNKVFYCLPIIEESARTKTDRFVNKLEEGKLVVFNKEERLFDYNVKPVRQLPEKTFERLRLSYEKFLASTPNEQAVEKHNVVPHDGFRSGNAWEGIASVPGHIKVYRG